MSQHGGALWLPRRFDELRALVPAPTPLALAIYGCWLLLHALLAMVAPGKIVDGAQLRDGTRLPYKLNGLVAFVVSLGVVVGLLAGGVVRASTIVAELGPLITTATLLI